MNQDDFNEVIVRQTDRCKSLLMAKGVEYAPKAVKNAEVDRLAHFKKAAVVMNSTPKAALMGMLSKHLIKNWYDRFSCVLHKNSCKFHGIVLNYIR